MTTKTLPPIVQRAINAIVERGCSGDTTKTQAKDDMGMFWFCGMDLIDAGIVNSAQGAGGVIHAMDRAGLAMSDRKQTGPKGGTSLAWCLTEAAIAASELAD
jgi:hypothetical protein